ncbi:MAG TPA: hypothetical protein VL983_07310 [Terriglobales bacterium]|nr:hypothetical protein [Terriglobales bacterium]
MLCIFSIALLCVMGSVQAVHAHPDDSTAHHDCSICPVAHIGLSIGPAITTPVFAAALLAAVPLKSATISRAAHTCFIRPPPAF